MESAPASTPSGQFEHRSGYYERVCDLASGGMGTVTIALRKEGTFRRLYAIKRLHTHLRGDPEFRAMFMDEARIAGMIHHPNVVGVLDVGEDSNGPFLVMDYIDGVSLSAVLSLASRLGEMLPIDFCGRVALDVARGLSAAHQIEGRDGQPLCVVHRDVSPANVLLGFDGIARLTDFGIARAMGRTSKTATGMIKGKFSYLSPEQLRFEEPDQRSDLFSLGVVLYELLGLTRLYKGNDGPRRILNEPPPDIAEIRPEVPSLYVSLLFDMLAKDPEHRPASAAEVVRRLEDALKSDDTAERVDVRAYVCELAGQYREERRKMVDESLSRLENVPSVKPPPPTAVAKVEAPAPRSRRLLLLAASTFLGGVITAVGVSIGLGGDDPPSEPASSSSPATVEVEQQPIAEPETAITPRQNRHDMTAAGADPEATTEASRVPDEPAATDEPTSDAEERPRRVSTRMRRRPGMEAPTAMGGSSGLMLRGWDGNR